jgi:hypothetical protein
LHSMHTWNVTSIPCPLCHPLQSHAFPLLITSLCNQFQSYPYCENKGISYHNFSGNGKWIKMLGKIGATQSWVQAVHQPRSQRNSHPWQIFNLHKGIWYQVQTTRF